MKVTHSTVNSSRAENFMRSAKAPTIRAGVMQANVIWKQTKTYSGMYEPFENVAPSVVGDVRLDPQGRHVYYASTDRPGIRRMDLRFANEVVVDPAVPARYWNRRWLVTPAGVQGVVRTAACVGQWSAPGSQPAVEPRCLDDVLAAGAIVQGVPTTDRAGDWLYLTHALPTTGIDIGMAVLPD